MRLHHRYSLVIATLLVSTVVMIAGAAVVTFGSLSARTQTASARVMSTALHEQAITAGRNLVMLAGQILATSLYHADMRDLDADLQSIRGYKGVVTADVVDSRGDLLLGGDGASSDPGRRKHEAVTRDALDKRAITTAIDGDILSVAAPLIAGDRLLGAVHVDMSLADLTAHVSNLRDAVANISQDARQSLIGIIGLAAFGLGVVGLLAGVLVARGLSQPIKALSLATRHIGQGADALDLPTERSDEIGDLARDLRQMANGLRQADRLSRLATVGEVAVGVAHELNQPLNTIRMAADNALVALDEPAADVPYLRAKLDLVSQLAGRMGEQIQRMCAVGRRDERRITFDPLPSVRDALALHSGGLEAEGIELTVAWPEGQPAFVQGLPNQFMQVIVNLIANARDAIIERGNTPMGRVRSVRGRIRLAIAVDEIVREVRIEIVDNGGGIPPEIIGRIFDPFFTTKEVNKGTGLGLSISYGIVAGMGGHINARNGADGAIFSVVLPLMSAADAHAAE